MCSSDLHTGTWIERRHRYVWVVGTKRHHHTPVHWVKTGKTTGYVPIHPRDVKGQTPLNLKNGVMKPVDKNGGVERVAYADGETWTVDDIRPYVEHSIESFGWDRVVWGSDWPVCTLTASLSIWIAATHAITQSCSNEERAKLMSGNARRVWRLPA